VGLKITLQGKFTVAEETKLTTKDLLALRKMKREHARDFKITELSDKEEKAFQSFIEDSGWYKEFTRDFGGPPQLNDPGYDYRGAWKEMGEDMFGVDPESGKIHGFSRTPSGKWLKSPDHPTAIKEYMMEIQSQKDRK
jgi:hypothetical protein